MTARPVSPHRLYVRVQGKDHWLTPPRQTAQSDVDRQRIYGPLIEPDAPFDPRRGTIRLFALCLVLIGAVVLLAAIAP